MRDPVIDNEGNSYEREKIEEWLKRGNMTSPLARTVLTVDMLKPNCGLRNAIESFLSCCGSKGSGGGVPEERGGREKEEKVNQVTLQTYTLPKEDGNTQIVDVCVCVPTSGPRIALELVVVIDVSEPMGNPATIMEAGVSKDIGFSMLDVVKHTLRLLIAALGPEDKLGLVAFSTQAKVVQELTFVTSANKGLIEAKVLQLQAEGVTNMWDGLRLGLKVLETGRTGRPEAGSTMLFMTGGLPSAHLTPARGIVTTLERALSRLPFSAPAVHTMGFGYNFDMGLVLSLAKLGHGTFSCIPDSSFVETVLVHWVANLYCTFAQRAALRIEYVAVDRVCVREAEVVGVTGYRNEFPVVLGGLQYGQNRDVQLKVQGDPRGLRAVLVYTPCVGRWAGKVQMAAKPVVGAYAEVVGEQQQQAAVMKLHAETPRLRFVEALSEVVEACDTRCDFKSAREEVATFIRSCEWGTGGAAAVKAAVGVLDDAQGQVTLALSTENIYQQWGRSYLLSLLLAHRQQRCTNFKDLGLAGYGGKMFNEERDRIGDLFSLVPPTVPLKVQTGRNGTDAGVNRHARRLRKWKREALSGYSKGTM